MMGSVDQVTNMYGLLPTHIPSTNQTDYHEAIRVRVQDQLLQEYRFLFQRNPNGTESVHPTIREGVILFLWFPIRQGEAIGIVYAREFDDELILLWIMANLGATVGQSPSSSSNNYLHFTMLGLLSFEDV
jgi:hypothetical protein